MNYKVLVLSLVVLNLSLQAAAQKVKRKGTTPNQVNNPANKKEPAAQYVISQLNGKWQEVKRVSKSGKEPVEFSDSLLMHIEDDKVSLKDATSMRMSMKGEAAIEAPNLLVVAGDMYTIRSLDKTTLIIEDDEFTREMQQKELYYYETLGKLKVATDSVSGPANIDIKNLKGKWLVYARKAEPGATNEQTALIKSIEITAVSDDGIAFGQASFYTKDITKSSACQVVTQNGALKIVTDQYIWNFYVYKADGKEFVFGEVGKLVYYSKQ